MCVLIHSSMTENKSTVSILDDIGSMFDDLADQLDAMLEWRAQHVSLWHNLRTPGEHKGTMTNNIPTYPFLVLIPCSSHPLFSCSFPIVMKHPSLLSPSELVLHKPELMYLRTGQKAIQGFKHQKQSRGWRGRGWVLIHKAQLSVHGISLSTMSNE